MPGTVLIADSIDEFEQQIHRALQSESRSKEEIRRRRERVQEMSWDSVVRRAWNRIRLDECAGDEPAHSPKLEHAASVPLGS